MKKGLPVVGCDFNACGWSQEPDDNCFYAFTQQDLIRAQPFIGKRIIVYMEDTDRENLACEAVLEQWQNRWRARPDESSWSTIAKSEFHNAT